MFKPRASFACGVLTGLSLAVVYAWVSRSDAAAQDCPPAHPQAPALAGVLATGSSASPVPAKKVSSAEEHPDAGMVRLLESKLRAAEKRLDQFEGFDVPEYCATHLDKERCSMVDPPQDVLEALAECGRVRYDDPQGWPASIANDMGLSEEEQARGQAATQAFNAERGKQAEELFQSLDPEAQAHVIELESRLGSPPDKNLLFRIQLSLAKSDLQAARRRLAEERAGIATPRDGESADSPADALIRLQASAGDAYEKALADALGEETASSLRLYDNGWSAIYLSSGDCESE